MQYSQFRHQYVALALDYNSTGMGSYHQPVTEICTLKCGAFIGKEHVTVVTRKGKEGFLCIQLFRKVILVPYRLSMASKKDKYSGEKCSLCSDNNNGRQAHPQKWSVELQTFVMEVTVLMKCDDVCVQSL